MQHTVQKNQKAGKKPGNDTDSQEQNSQVGNDGKPTENPIPSISAKAKVIAFLAASFATVSFAFHWLTRKPQEEQLEKDILVNNTDQIIYITTSPESAQKIVLLPQHAPATARENNILPEGIGTLHVLNQQHKHLFSIDLATYKEYRNNYHCKVTFRPTTRFEKWIWRIQSPFYYSIT